MHTTRKRSFAQVHEVDVKYNYIVYFSFGFNFFNMLFMLFIVIVVENHRPFPYTS